MAQLGIENLVSVGIDAALVAKDIKKQLADGFQFQDVVTIGFGNFARIKNVADKAKTALAEIKDLTPEELELFEERVADGAGIPNEGVAGKVRKSIRLAARVYRLVDDAIDIVHDGADIFRDEE